MFRQNKSLCASTSRKNRDPVLDQHLEHGVFTEKEEKQTSTSFGTDKGGNDKGG